MSKATGIKEQDLRKERNSDVIRRMKNGDQLSSFNSYSSWFPPRPVIEKNEKDVQELYGQSPRPLRNVKTLPKKEDHRQKELRKLRLA